MVKFLNIHEIMCNKKIKKILFLLLFYHISYVCAANGYIDRDTDTDTTYLISSTSKYDVVDVLHDPSEDTSSSAGDEKIDGKDGKSEPTAIYHLFDDLNKIAKIYFNELLTPPLEIHVIESRLYEFQTSTRVSLSILGQYVPNWLEQDSSKNHYYNLWKHTIGERKKKGKKRQANSLHYTGVFIQNQKLYSLIEQENLKSKTASYSQVLQLYNAILQMYIICKENGENFSKIITYINPMLFFFDRFYKFNHVELLEAIPSDYSSYLQENDVECLTTYIRNYFSKKISERLIYHPNHKYNNISYADLYDEISQSHRKYSLLSIFTLQIDLALLFDVQGQNIMPFDIPLEDSKDFFLLEDSLSLFSSSKDKKMRDVLNAGKSMGLYQSASVVQNEKKPRALSCGDADDEREQPLKSLVGIPKLRHSIGFSIEEIQNYVQERVIGQDDSIAILCALIHQHYTGLYVNSTDHKKARKTQEDTDLITIRKSNILMMGETGTGKTLTIETIERFMKSKGLPILVSIFNAASLTRTGYTGPSVSDIFLELYEKAQRSLERAQTALVFIDEVDKIFATSQATGRDIGGVSVQNELLAILQGCDINLSIEDKKSSHNILMSTENILFVCGGAFSMIPSTIKNVKNDDLFRAGFSREFIGRLHCRVRLDSITKETVVKILQESKESRFKQLQKLYLKGYGLNLSIALDAIESIADSMLSQKTGARAIQGFVDSLLLRVIPNPQKIVRDDGSDFLISKEMVESFASEYFG